MTDHDDREARPEAPIAHFDFMVAGAKLEQFAEFIDGAVGPRDEILFEREPDNEHDKNAVRVHAGRNYCIGYVPREDAEAMAKLLDSGAKYLAHVKKMLGDERQIPVVVADFYPADAEGEALRTEQDATKGCGCCLGLLVAILGGAGGLGAALIWIL